MGNVKFKPVTFKAKLDNSGAVEFSGINRVDVKNDNSGDYHLITFILDQDSTGRDLVFRPISSTLNDSPFWIQDINKGCPQTAAGMPGVVEPLFVSPNRKELTVINYNAKIEEMKFALRMVENANPANGHSYDPIMNNQNGGGGGIDLAEAAVIGFSLASIAAIAYVSMYGGMS